MSIKKVFSAYEYTTFTDLSLLLLRIVAGIAFVLHGWPKMQSPFSWMGPDAAIPGFFLFLAAIAEFGGGFAWILGLLTPLASFGLACTMLVAFSFHAFVKGDPFVGKGEGATYELALVYLCISILFIAMGPGRYSLDRKFFGRK